MCECVSVCACWPHLILLTGFSSQKEASDGDAAQILWTGLQTELALVKVSSS